MLIEGGDMRAKRLRRKIHFIIWGAMLALFLASPSFAQTQPEKGGPLTIQKIEVAGSGPGFRVLIEGSTPFEYTVFKGSNPVRVIVEMPKAKLGKLAKPIEVRNGTVNVIRSRETEYGARVEIGLDQPVDYQVLEEANSLYIELGVPFSSAPSEIRAQAVPASPKPAVAQAPPAKPPSATRENPKEAAAEMRSMKEVAVSEKGDLLEVALKGGEGLADYRYFQLARPPRLVVDLPKVTNATSKRLIEVGRPLLKDIRLGQYPEKLRLVFTFPGNNLPPYQMAKNGEGLKVLLGQAKSKEEVKPIPVAQAAAPPPAQKEAEPAPTTAEKKPEPAPVQPAAPVPPPAKANGPEKETPAEMKVEADKTQLSPYKGAKISLDFKDADIHNIFRLIAEVSNLNIITTDEVKGKVTIRLVNVPWDQALDVILTTKNLIKIEEGNVLRITTLDSVRKDREEKQKEEETLLKTRETKLKLEEPWRKIIKVNYAKAEDIQKLLLEKKDEGKGFLSPQGSVKADKRTNTLIIQDVRNNLEEIEQLIKQLDSATPQVLIEARVVQAQTTFARSLGVQWGGSYNQTAGSNWFWGLTGAATATPGWAYSPTANTYNVTTGTQATQIAGPNALSMPSSFIVNFPASSANTSTGGMGISFGKLTGSLVNLDLRLSLGETDGKTKVIARPKLATLDNTKAHIKQGELIPYETTSQAGTQVQFIDAVLLLEVTPHVTPDGTIKMIVKITRDARGSFRTQINQVPSVDKREASTEVLVKDGETIVIGGIYESENSETTAGIPWVKDVPILGWLFKNQDTLNIRRELLIFITPTILQAKSE
jgi:type IV pilus assembly protein PilQ